MVPIPGASGGVAKRAIKEALGNKRIWLKEIEELGEAITGKWHKGTLKTVEDSMLYHVGKHGKGRTLKRYTDDAVNFFNANKDQAQWGKWNPDWEPSYKIKIGDKGGYFTKDGQILSYWD